MAILMMAVGGCTGMYCIYVQGREDETKLSIIGVSVFFVDFRSCAWRVIVGVYD